jgi:exosortase B
MSAMRWPAMWLPRRAMQPFVIMAAGLACLYGPTFFGLFTGLWISDKQGHGPIIFGIVTWLLYRKWPVLASEAESAPARIAGWAAILVGCLLYFVGRSQSILIFEIGSLIWMLTGTLLLLRGWKAVKHAWFPLFFMMFMIPLPGGFVDAVTQPMKLAVSYVAESGLYALGYPIARSGVILQIGQYQLLVADACAGLQTLFTLEALGLFYLNIVQHSSVFRNIALAILVVPISFTANVIRVCILTLITYYLGDDAGQGFLHGFAGMVLFISALLLIILADGTLRLIADRRASRAMALRGA